MLRAWPSAISVWLALVMGFAISRAEAEGRRSTAETTFAQLDQTLPTPGRTRTASGAPGPDYWQQAVDYRIQVGLDPATHRITGSEEVRYSNNSPHELRYLWLQLDANIYSPGSDRTLTATSDGFDRVSHRDLEQLLTAQTFDGSVTLSGVTDRRGQALDWTVVGTMMRLDLPRPLAPGKTFVFRIDWSYTIGESRRVPGRTGFERFDDGNLLYEVAQWFPRLAAYDDMRGWQHKQFLGRGEFTLEFGDYVVDITVPSDYVVAATGELVNDRKVLSEAQRARLAEARRSGQQTFVVTAEEASANAASKRATDTKTWRFSAENVRDFAFAASPKFIWDVQATELGGRQVLGMSFYPIEGEPLWSRYSTRAVLHALDVYSRYAFEYPYPVAISVNGPIHGMEYPMICFNGPRPEKDGTYSERTKLALISVIIHEVGHNYFPMIVNSDERQWTWLDEGINSFIQYRAEQEWKSGYPSRRGEPRDIVDYMKSEAQVPIMTQSDSLLAFGNNAYSKPATALNILRETVMGRELFDFAFAEYARRWQFKRPTPADFFRTMEDASAVDLDWFWRGWFYTTDHVDVELVGVHEWVLDTGDPEATERWNRGQKDATPPSLSEQRDARLPKVTATHKGLEDFYDTWDPLATTDRQRKRFETYLRGLDEHEREVLQTKARFFAIRLKNRGGLVTPVILALRFADGSTRELRIPAEIWRVDDKEVTKLILAEQDLVGVEVDPHLETADVDHDNNVWPPRPAKTRFQLFKERAVPNPMQEAGVAPVEKPAP